MRRQIIAEQLEAVLRNSLQAPGLRLLNLDGERPSVDAKREPWIEIKYGPASPDDWFGIVPATALFERCAGNSREALHLIVKVNPRLGLARNLIPWSSKTNRSGSTGLIGSIATPQRRTA